MVDNTNFGGHFKGHLCVPHRLVNNLHVHYVDTIRINQLIKCPPSTNGELDMPPVSSMFLPTANLYDESRGPPDQNTINDSSQPCPKEHGAELPAALKYQKKS